MNKLNEFINNPPTCTHNVTDPAEMAIINSEIFESDYVRLFFSLSDDIIGHIDKMNEIASEYLLNETEKYIDITLISHAICSVIIFITFFIFISRPLKKQLLVIDSLTNITFSIPSSIYNSSPKFKKYVYIDNNIIFYL